MIFERVHIKFKYEDTFKRNKKQLIDLKYFPYYLSIFRSVSIHMILQVTELFALSNIDKDISSLQGTKLS